MAISASLLTDGALTTNLTSYDTASISPTAGRALLVFAQFAGIGTATPSTVSGLSGTWTNVGGSFRYNTSLDMSVHWCSNYTGSGVLHIGNADTGAHIIWSVIEIDGANTAAPVVGGSFSTASPGSANGVTITLPAAANANNRVFAAFGCDNSTAGQAAPRASWTEFSDLGITTPTGVMETQWRSDAHETTASVTWTGGPYASAGIAVEVAAAGTTASSLIIPRRPLGALLDM